MRCRVVACGCLLALALALHAGCRSSSDQTGRLTGTVRDSTTKSPIDNAEVTVGAATAFTDSRGAFLMEELEVGERSATVAAAGYHTLTKAVTIDAGNNTAVFDVVRLGNTDGGQTDGPQSDGPQQDAGQNDGGICSGNSCTYGLYSGGGCCATAPYCANYNGSSYLICRSTCGAVNERCSGNGDCCNGYCAGGYCAQPSCAGTSCTYGYYGGYGGCCADSPYCTNNYGYSYSICRSTCGAVNERCATGYDCCNSNCVSGYCAEPSCASNTCTYGYYDYTGCCASAPYCTNYNGSSYMICRATCGATSERCYSNGDCCSSYCLSGYCAVASCAGTACTYGYAYGQCCATQIYCVNSYGATALVCRATCGATYERCGYNTDCCNGTCAYNSTYGQVLCN
jgi:hypothetical protein